MRTLLLGAPALNIVVAAAGGLIAGLLLARIYFRERIWVMEQRLSDYAERRATVKPLEVVPMVCPVCLSRALCRSNTRSLGVFFGRLIGRVPYRCERCFQVSFHWRDVSYSVGKRVDTRENLESERRHFADQLRVTRKMRRVYPEMFDKRKGTKGPEQRPQ